MYWRRIKDRIAGKSMLLAVAFANSIVLLIALGLFVKSRPILAKKSILHLLLSSSWHPLKGEFGFYPFIIGTLEVTAIAMILSIPVCLLSAIYLSEYAHRRVRDLARLVIDIMAAIPSVIYGLWGVIVIVPFVRASDSSSTPRPPATAFLPAGSFLPSWSLRLLSPSRWKCFAPFRSRHGRQPWPWEQQNGKPSNMSS